MEIDLNTGKLYVSSRGFLPLFLIESLFPMRDWERMHLKRMVIHSTFAVLNTVTIRLLAMPRLCCGWFTLMKKAMVFTLAETKFLSGHAGKPGEHVARQLSMRMKQYKRPMSKYFKIVLVRGNN